VALYESNSDAVKARIATFLDAFPNGIVWGNTKRRQGDTKSGAARPGGADQDRRRTRSRCVCSARSNAPVKNSLGRSACTRRSTCSRPRRRKPVSNRGCATPPSTGDRQSPSAVPGGLGLNSVPGGRDLRRHAEAVSSCRRICSRNRGDEDGSLHRNTTSAREIGALVVRLRRTVVNRSAAL